MDEIELVLEEIEQKLTVAKERGQSLVSERITEALDGDLGAIVVNGYGQLVDITLERANLRYTNESALGQQIVQTLQRAEERATAVQQQAQNSWR